jgi:hypothetical protein
MIYMKLLFTFLFNRFKSNVFLLFFIFNLYFKFHILKQNNLGSENIDKQNIYN